jgi:guanyl-specific ribonuclease Sa
VLELIIPPVLAFVLGWLAKQLGVESQWSRIRSIAVATLKDTTKTNNPREAVTLAMWNVQLERLEREARKVLDAFVINGSNPYPKQDSISTSGNRTDGPETGRED